MKSFLGIACITLLLSSCASQNYHYQSQSNPQKWEGKNIAEVQKRWGSADQVFHTRSGVSYYLYDSNSGANFFSSTSTNFSLAESSVDFPLRNQIQLQCTAIFKTDKNNIIISTSHSGSNCGGQWAPGNH